MSTDFDDRSSGKERALKVERTMEAEAVSGRARGAVRCGRPPRGLAGKVEERILDAAGKVFLKHGFSGASVDEIAEAASAGKPTIYARYPGKEALFTAVVERLVRRNTSLDALSCADGSIEQRLDALAAVLLNRVLTPETIGLIRVAVAEARRFPDLATSVSRMGRERPTEAVAHVFGELAASSEIGASPAFSPEKLRDTARRFLDLVVLPMLVRALFGEDLAALRAEIGSHAARTVAFFLAACGPEGPPPGSAGTASAANPPADHGAVAG
jgi:AcrR family transcriptional regulator